MLLHVSMHLTVKRDWLTEESKTNALQDIMVANKSKVQVVSASNVSITTIVGKYKYNVLVKDVLYVSQLTTNLLSVSQLIKNGNEVKVAKFITNRDS